VEKIGLQAVFDDSQFGAGVNRYLGGLKKISAGFTDIKSMLSMGVALFNQVTDAIMAPINEFGEYARAVKDMSLITGTGVEATSRLIQVADDLTISQDTLTTSLRYAVDKGYAVNIDALAKMADEYVAIQDPVEKANYALDRFGARAGVQMAKMLEQGGDAIKNMYQNVEEGLVVTEEAAAAAREYEIAQDNLEDTMKSMQYTIGKALIPVVTDLINGIMNLFKSQEQLNREMMAAVKAAYDASDSYEEYRKNLREANKELFEYIKRQKELGILGMNTGEIERQYAAWEKSSYALEGVVRGFQKAQEKGDAMRQALVLAAQADDELVASFTRVPETLNNTTGAMSRLEVTTDLVTASMKELTSETLFQQAVQGLSPEQYLATARAMGKLDEATYLQLAALEQLKHELKSGEIQIDDYNKKLYEMDRWLRTIPKDTRVQVALAVSAITTGNVGPLPGNATGGGGGSQQNPYGGAYGGAYGMGGSFIARRPTMITVGDRGAEAVNIMPLQGNPQPLPAPRLPGISPMPANVTNNRTSNVTVANVYMTAPMTQAAFNTLLNNYAGGV